VDADLNVKLAGAFATVGASSQEASEDCQPPHNEPPGQNMILLLGMVLIQDPG